MYRHTHTRTHTHVAKEKGGDPYTVDFGKDTP